MKKLFGCVGSVLWSWVSALLGCLAIALLLNSTGATMSWYANPVWIFFLYVIPTYTACMLTIYLHASYFNKVSHYRNIRNYCFITLASSLFR